MPSGDRGKPSVTAPAVPSSSRVLAGRAGFDDWNGSVVRLILQLLRADPWVASAAALVGMGVPVAVLYWYSPDLMGRYSIWLEFLALGLALVVLVRRGLGATRLETRVFWLLIAAAYLLWILADAVLEGIGGASISVHAGLVGDLCFLFLYLALVMALELRAHLGPGGVVNRPLVLVEMIGGVVAGFALFVYFVMIPLRITTSAEWSPSYPFYLLLDALVLFGIYRNMHTAAATGWRQVYQLMGCAFTALLLVDLMGASVGWGVIPGVESAFFGMEPLWLVVHVFVVASARVPVSESPAIWDVLPKAMEVQPQTRFRRSSLILYALSLPIIHLAAYSLNLMDEGSRGLRDVSVLGFLMVFGALALIHLQRVETERAEARENYRRLFDACPVMIVVVEGTGQPGRILDCNPLFSATVGVDERTLLGRNLASMVTPFPSPGIESDAAEAPWEGQLQLGLDAGLPVLVHQRRFSGSGGPVWLVTLVDLSHQKILEERLRHAQRLESLGRLAGGVAHDFNNILTVVEGYSSLLAERLEQSPELLDHAREIQTSAQRAARLVQQLLAFGRRQLLRPTRTRLNGEVAKFSQVLRRILRPELQLVLRLEAERDEVRVDVGQIQDVLLNLVANAQDAIRGSGVVCIATRDAELTEVEGGGLSAARAYVALEVVDTGVGISRELQEKIFEPFFTTKGPATASGLGLASVLGIVEQSGGHISVISEPGAGATFRILLPQALRQTPVP
jgi:signal transduction histidine kinase